MDLENEMNILNGLRQICESCVQGKFYFVNHSSCFLTKSGMVVIYNISSELCLFVNILSSISKFICNSHLVCSIFMD